MWYVYKLLRREFKRKKYLKKAVYNLWMHVLHWPDVVVTRHCSKNIPSVHRICPCACALCLCLCVFVYLTKGFPFISLCQLNWSHNLLNKVAKNHWNWIESSGFFICYLLFLPSFCCACMCMRIAFSNNQLLVVNISLSMLYRFLCMLKRYRWRKQLIRIYVGAKCWMNSWVLM